MSGLSAVQNSGVPAIQSYCPTVARYLFGSFSVASAATALAISTLCLPHIAIPAAIVGVLAAAIFAKALNTFMEIKQTQNMKREWESDSPKDTESELLTDTECLEEFESEMQQNVVIFSITKMQSLLAALLNKCA